MEDLLDRLWFNLVELTGFFKSLLDFVFAPLNVIGPAFAISVIALLTVLIIKILAATLKTKRYETLKKEFEYWFKLRQQAMQGDDSEKARQLAKNIDQVKLNKAYYDYFFEGFMLGLVTRYQPVLIFASYVNEAYRAEDLIKYSAHNYVFIFEGLDSEAFPVGGVFWFILSILLVYLGWFLINKIYSKIVAKRDQTDLEVVHEHES